jgi:serine/threonine protein phosphatase PrpC
MSSFTHLTNNIYTTTTAAQCALVTEFDSVIDTESDCSTHFNSIHSNTGNTEEFLRKPEITFSEIFYLMPEKIHSIKENITGATYKMGGSGKDDLENQDATSTCFITVDGIEHTLNVMCDGHGIDGKIYADITVANLPIMIQKRFDEVLADPVVVINEIFALFIKELSITLKHKDGGTTVTVSIFSDGCLIVANIGDCEAFLKTNAPDTSIFVERNGQLIPTEITNNCIHATTDHNFNNPDEIIRVFNTGARIKYATNRMYAQQIDAYKQIVENGIVRYEEVPHSNQIGGFKCNMSGEPSRYIYDSVSGNILNMTRSIGDWGTSFLSAKPDVTKITWSSGNRARLLIGSDGYFNCLTRENQFNELSFDFTPNIICERAYKAVGDIFTHSRADNMTICVCDIL